MAKVFEPEKFRELIRFIAFESRGDTRFGATKLNKILYFSDFKAFGILGESITGADYQRLDRGPAPVQLLPVLQEMERAGDITIDERRYYNRRQKAVRSVGSVTAEDLLAVGFSDEEIQIVRTVINDLKELNASQVSALSHLEAGWQLAEDREVIPYETVYISDRRPTLRELSMWEADVEQRRFRRSAS